MKMTKILGILLALVTVLNMFALVGCSGDKGDETTKADTTEADTTAEDTTAEDTTAEDTTAEDTTEADTTNADTTEAETTKKPETQANTQPPVTNPPQTTPPQTQAPVTNNSGQEMAGKGSKSDPYLEIPVVGSGSMSVKTVSIPAGKSIFYGIQRIGGMIVTINSASAYVVCDGVKYTAKNGVVSFMAPAALASDFVSLEIGNAGGAAASFTLVFTNPIGTQANPFVVKTMGSSVKVSLAKEDSDGYTYKYKAEKAGTIRFTMTASTESILSVTNNRNSTQRNTEADMADGTNYIEIQVQAGDELIIVVGAKPNARGKYPAADITWTGKYN